MTSSTEVIIGQVESFVALGTGISCAVAVLATTVTWVAVATRAVAKVVSIIARFALMSTTFAVRNTGFT